MYIIFYKYSSKVNKAFVYITEFTASLKTFCIAKKIDFEKPCFSFFLIKTLALQKFLKPGQIASCKKTFSELRFRNKILRKEKTKNRKLSHTRL